MHIQTATHTCAHERGSISLHVWGYRMINHSLQMATLGREREERCSLPPTTIIPSDGVHSLSSFPEAPPADPPTTRSPQYA